MPDERYFPAIPNDQVEDWRDDVRAGIVEDSTEKRSSNPVDDALAEELKKFVPEDWAAKSNLDDIEDIRQFSEMGVKIAVLRRYGIDDWADTLEERVEEKLKLLDSVDAKMLRGLFRVFESFGGGSTGPGDDSSGGVGVWLKSDLTRDDDE